MQNQVHMYISLSTQAPHNNAWVIPCMLLKYLRPEKPKQFIKFLKVHHNLRASYTPVFSLIQPLNFGTFV